MAIFKLRDDQIVVKVEDTLSQNIRVTKQASTTGCFLL